MMKTNVYSVFDNKAAAFLPPMFFTTDGLALRSFIAALTDDAHFIAKHPGDFTLFRIGTFDDDTGLLVADKSHTDLGNGYVLKVQIAEDFRKRSMPSDDNADNVSTLRRQVPLDKLNS